jgi:thiosulfate dehydrogenase [quinone] large subunit
VAAGVDKLADPQFLDPNAAGYIGTQLSGFAAHSPIKFILTNLAVPNATFFGLVVMLGELAIGLGTLLGLFTRTAAFFGLVLSLMLWLTASWEVTPFFLGSDLPYAMGWLVLLIAGAHPVFSLDGQLQKRQAQNAAPKGVEVVQGWNQPLPAMANNAEPVDIARRRFLVMTGALVVAGMATGVAWAKTWHDENEGSGAAGNTAATLPNPTTQPTAANNAPATAPAAASNPTAAAPTTAAGSATLPAQTTSSASNTPATTTKPAANTTTAAPAISGKVLASISSLAVGDGRKFTTPDTGEPAILIRETDGSVKAFSTTCTHEGCDLTYVKTAQALVCPCHGAQFSAQTGEVTRRPARRPLTSYKVQVDGSGNIVYLQNQ